MLRLPTLEALGLQIDGCAPQPAHKVPQAPKLPYVGRFPSAQDEPSYPAPGSLMWPTPYAFSRHPAPKNQQLTPPPESMAIECNPNSLEWSAFPPLPALPSIPTPTTSFPQPEPLSSFRAFELSASVKDYAFGLETIHEAEVLNFTKRRESVDSIVDMYMEVSMHSTSAWGSESEPEPESEFGSDADMTEGAAVLQASQLLPRVSSLGAMNVQFVGSSCSKQRLAFTTLSGRTPTRVARTRHSRRRHPSIQFATLQMTRSTTLRSAQDRRSLEDIMSLVHVPNLNPQPPSPLPCSPRGHRQVGKIACDAIDILNL
ncbi:hypothetical protein CspHIS471_0104110 [Cutaneotrichosporon sp. HIS471]|nr:hypothetical protein CspHIS471_0104110 [Cutaneotrichosporon sp. HIS471]